MSNESKNFNIFDIVNETKPEPEPELKPEIKPEVIKKRMVIISNSQKIKSVQYKTTTSNKKQTEINISKLASFNTSKYLTPVKPASIIPEDIIPNNIIEKINVRSIIYTNSFINSLNTILWIDASDLTSILRNGNNNVYQILDKSGNYNHLYQNIAANQPKYHNGGLLFNGNQLISGNYTLDQDISNMSLFIVMKQYNQVTNGGIISGYTNNYLDLNSWAFTSTDTTTGQYLFSTNSSVNPNLKNSNNINTTMPYGIYEIVINSNNGKLYYNGNLIDTKTFITTGNFTNLTIGAKYDGTNKYNGEIYEVLLLNTSITNGNRYKVEKYLMDKWATAQISRTIPISNIYSWLDASSSNNFTLDTNNNILSWNDKNFKLNFTQSNPTFYPKFDTNKVVFSGSYLTMIDTTGLNLNNFTIFYVFNQITHNNNASLLSCINTLGQNDSAISNGFSLTTNTSSTVRLTMNSINFTTTNTLTNKSVYEFNVSNSVGTNYLNGVRINTITLNTLGTGLRFAIGAIQNAGVYNVSAPLNANVYEIIILNTSATYEQRSQIYSYLNEKWTIPCYITNPIPNPVFWLDSTNSGSITVDGSSNVTSWLDLSSNPRTVTINNTKPVTSTVNGLRYVYFTGSDLSVNIPALVGNNFTLYMVFSGNTMTTNNSRLISFNNDTNDASTTSFNINSGNNTGMIQYNSSTNLNETLNFNNTLYILSIQIVSNVVSIYINNYLVGTTTNTVNFNFRKLNIGNILGGSLPWIGYINEVILYTSAFNTINNQGMISYLSNKWSINVLSSSINQYISRSPIDVANTIKLTNIFTSAENNISLSNLTNIDLPVTVPISTVKSNQLNIISSDTIYLSGVDINTVYYINPVVPNCVINLPVLSINGDYFAFTGLSVYPVSVTGPNGLNYQIGDTNSTWYFTNTDGTYNVSNTFQGFVASLNQYNVTTSSSFKLYLGGWSNTLGYINKLYVYNSAGVLLANISNIYFDLSYQADFKLGPGTFDLVISDTLSSTGNVINYSITTPVVVPSPTVTLDHYFNGSSTYIITFSSWIFSDVTTLDVWVSSSSDYSNSTYLTTTSTIQNNTATFTNVFTSGAYWITLKYTFPFININISDSIINTSMPYVAVGTNIDNTVSIARSSDGLIWANSTNNPFSSGVPAGIAWNGSYWLALGTNFSTVSIAKSSDGLTWTNATSNPFSNGTGRGAAWNGSYWIAVGQDGGYTVSITKSTDGLVWTNANNNLFTRGGYGVAWNGSLWVAVGFNLARNVTIVRSTDGLTWTSSANPFGSGGEGYGIAWNGFYWIAVGLNTTGSICIAKSTDGITWSVSTNNPFLNGSGRGIAWNGSYWVATGANTGGAVCIAKSSNGLVWTNANNNPFSGGLCFGIAWNGLYWVAVGRNSSFTVSIARSIDGLTWVNSTNNSFRIGYGIASSYINFSFSLDNTTHLSNNYNIKLVGWTNLLTTSIPMLYINGYLNSNYSDTPYTLVAIPTLNIVNTNGVYTLPFSYTFDISRNYYLSVSSGVNASGSINVFLTNNISKLNITGTVTPIGGYSNTNNVFTITLSNNENYNLYAYNLNWTIYYAYNNLGNNLNIITTSTINSNQQIVFTYNPGSDTTPLYFYVSNTSSFVLVQ
jgi:hypothetical protein